MKYCLSSRQTPEYLRQADEIRVQSRDYKQIYDLFDNYPNATIILNYMPDSEKYEKTVRELFALGQNRLILSLFNFEHLQFAQENEIRFMFSQPIQTLETLRTVKKLGACYAILDNYLMHNLHQAKIVGIPLRAIPNIAFLDNFSREDGVIGNWIRPENLDDYSIYIDAIEFGHQPQKREQALFRIYSKEKAWEGDLGILVQDLNYIGDNSKLDPEQTKIRMNCGHKCATRQGCNICYNLLDLSMKELKGEK